jgi:cell wall-associated NlpC family hydrolase
VNQGITRCARTGSAAQVCSVAWAALAVVILLLASIGLAPPATARASSSRPINTATATVLLRLHVWRYAIAQRYKPYIWGGTGPFGFDCSGLVYAAYRADEVMLPRTTYEMLHSWRLVRIPKSQARRGDLAFFGSGHVELYDWGPWTYGAAHPGSRIGFHRMNAFWHPTMYFRIRL